MKMNEEIIRKLRVLGFPEEKLPKMKELRKRYFELSLIRHPDKDTGTNAAFQELLNAYSYIGNLIEKSNNTDVHDTEEDAARKAYKESNIEKVNKTSVTIKISSAHVLAWESVFSEKYGNPIDRSHINATKQWVVPYKVDEKCFGSIKVTIWNLVQKEKSTMLIQGEHLKQYLNVSFAEKVIPKLFSEVVCRLPNVLINERPKSKTTKPKVKRPCKKCPMIFFSVSELNLHVLNSHESNFNACKTCDVKFVNKLLLDEHMNEKHSSYQIMMSNENRHPCDFCPRKFDTTNHLNTHIIISHSEELASCYLCGLKLFDGESIKTHMSESHGKKDEDKEYCDNCNLSFENGEDLRNHIKTIHEESMEDVETQDVTLDDIESGGLSLEENPEEVIILEETVDSSNWFVSSLLNEILLNLTEESGRNFEKDIVYEDIMNETEDDVSHLQEASDKEENEAEKHEAEEHEEEELEAIEPRISTPQKENNDHDDEANLEKDSTNKDTESNCGKDKQIQHLNEALNNLKEENEMMKQQVVELQEININQEIRSTELEKDLTQLKDTNAKGFEQYDALLKEFDKVKKEKNKISKENEGKVTVLNEELLRSYAKVDKIYKENVKLLEEKKVLQGIHKVNADMYEKLKDAENKGKPKPTPSDVNEEENVDDVVEEDYVEEEDEEIEMLNLFMGQKQNRSSRTSPASEAVGRQKEILQCIKCEFTAHEDSVLKEHLKTHMFKCTKCDEAHKTKGLLRRHMKDVHRLEKEEEPLNKPDTQPKSLNCNKCDFRGKSQIQMEKHNKVRHEDQPQKLFKNNNNTGGLDCTLCDFKGKSKLQMEKHMKVRHYEEPNGNTICLFWQRGVCRKGESCNFSHPAQPPPCRYKNFCVFWPYCRFGHEESVFCRYQEACKNDFCIFVHTNQDAQPFLGIGRKSQYSKAQSSPMWRPW